MKKSTTRNLLAVLIFALASFVYFYPTLQGYTLKMHDISTFKGMSKEIADHRELFGEEPLWTNAMFSGMPAYQISVKYPLNLINYLYQGLNSFPRPAEFIFLYALGFFILLRTLKIEYRLSIFGALAFALSSYFIIIIMAGHTSKAYAVAYMAPVLAGFVLSYRGRVLEGISLAGLAMALELRANHLQVTYYLGIILLFYVIAELVRAQSQGKLSLFVRRSLALGAVMAIALLSNFGNIYNTLGYTKYSTRGATELTIKADGSSNEDIVTSGLDRDYVTQWSYGIEETLTFIIPDAKGGATGQIAADENAMKKVDPQMRQFIGSNNRYWGDQSITSGPVYLGIIVVLLFFLGLASIKSRFKWVILGVGILAMMLSWGKNLMWFTDFFLNYIPGYNKFRAVTIILVVIEFVTPLLAFIYLNRIYLTPSVLNNKFKFQGKEYGNKFYITSGILGFILLVLYITPDSFLTFFSQREMDYFASQAANPQINRMIDGLKDVRIDIFKADTIRSFGFFAVAFVALLLYKTKTISKNAMIYSLGLLIVVDLWTVDKRYLNNDKNNGQYKQWEKRSEAQFAYKADKASLSILQRELEFNSSRPELAQMAEEALKAATAEAREDGRSRLSIDEENNIRFRTLNFNSDFRVLNIGVSTFNDASTSYFFKSIGGYHGAKLKSYKELIDFQIQPEIQELVGRLQNGVPPHIAFEDMNALNMLNTQYLIYNPNAEPVENPNRLGNAWFINEIKWVSSADEEILAIKDIDPANTAIVREEYFDKFTGVNPIDNPEDDIRLVDYKPNRMQYRSSSSNAGFAVFSEIYYPNGWKAFIDGKEAEILKANYILRGLVLPAGQHDIEFRFEPLGFTMANIVSFIASSFLILLSLWTLFKQYKGKLEVRNE